MSTEMQSEAKTRSVALAESNAQPNPIASFGTALLGFMVTTTLTTSIMVLLSQG